MQHTSIKTYNGNHDCVKALTQRELCKKFKFDITTKWYIHKPESVLENTT